jgi:hypothetical protein
MEPFTGALTSHTHPANTIVETTVTRKSRDKICEVKNSNADNGVAFKRFYDQIAQIIQ